MLGFLYLIKVYFENVFYGSSTSLFNSALASLAVIWTLQLVAYLTVLAFWKHQSVENQKLKIIVPIFTIFPAESCDYEKFVKKDDAAMKAANSQKSYASYAADHLLLISFLAVICVNFYFFAVLQ